ncbi:uncharacterized protein LOC107304811 [Oryza brachyantha]|uniref:Uncharacterized protein n=1 Tax=Oryza brachyantha TaxID=4533 RepID=J3MV31_ORYBR|nr:uncharacterized protein LOC107304811 [Oryza brachyantha]
MDGSLAQRRRQQEAEADGRRFSLFTALELAAAEHLIRLSESTTSSSGSRPRVGWASASSSFSSSASPRSVNNAPPPRRTGQLQLGDVDDDEDEQEVGGRPRRNRRVRPIAEIYAATAPIGGRKQAKAKAGGASE